MLASCAAVGGDCQIYPDVEESVDVGSVEVSVEEAEVAPVGDVVPGAGGGAAAGVVTATGVLAGAGGVVGVGVVSGAGFISVVAAAGGLDVASCPV
ncbi:MAG TPA: hypothetical protein VK419_15015 [Bryobacteraceae bacterium]|nr:hypothetical protein [Bryobacteraceae bacterium]